MLTEVEIVRYPDSNDEGTKGSLWIDGELFCYTLELPDRNNQRSISRIPAGSYKAFYLRHSALGHCYHLHDVPNRSSILIHKGNWAGDVSKGYRSDVEGCILVGREHAELAEQTAVTSSTSTMLSLIERLDKEDIIVNVRPEHI